MKMTSAVALVLTVLALASCANTVRGVTKDAKETGTAFQQGTDSVLKAGSTKKTQ